MGVSTLTDRFNQKKGVSVFVGDITEADVVAGTVLCNLPPDIYITKAFLDITTVSTTASSTIDLQVGAVVIANEIAATSGGYSLGTNVPAKFSGGALSAVVGAVAPAAGDLECTVYVEYIEYNKTNGETTNV